MLSSDRVIIIDKQSNDYQPLNLILSGDHFSRFGGQDATQGYSLDYTYSGLVGPHPAEVLRRRHGLAVGARVGADLGQLRRRQGTGSSLGRVSVRG